MKRLRAKEWFCSFCVEERLPISPKNNPDTLFTSRPSKTYTNTHTLSVSYTHTEYHHHRKSCCHANRSVHRVMIFSFLLVEEIWTPTLTVTAVTSPDLQVKGDCPLSLLSVSYTTLILISILLSHIPPTLSPSLPLFLSVLLPLLPPRSAFPLSLFLPSLIHHCTPDSLYAFVMDRKTHKCLCAQILMVINTVREHPSVWGWGTPSDNAYTLTQYSELFKQGSGQDKIPILYCLHRRLLHDSHAMLIWNCTMSVDI